MVDYIPPEIMQKTQKGTIDRTKNGLLGMAIVGALSSDPRLVWFQLNWDYLNNNFKLFLF